MGKLERGKVRFRYVCDDCGAFVQQIAVFAYRPEPRKLPARRPPTLTEGLIGIPALIWHYVRGPRR